MYRARQLIRIIEDYLFELKNGYDNARTMIEIRKIASLGLDELEGNEIEYSKSITTETLPVEKVKRK